jgi:hypothetical protein
VKSGFVWVLCLWLSACCTSKNSGKDFGADALVLIGTMQYLTVETGCWQFITDDGARYQVSGSQVDPLLRDGQRAEVIVRLLPDRQTICMTGKPVELLHIIKIY